MSSYSTSPPCTPPNSYTSLPSISPPASIRSSSSCSSNSTSYLQTPESFRQNHTRAYTSKSSNHTDTDEYDSGNELGMDRLSLASQSYTSRCDDDIKPNPRQLRHIKPRSRPSHASTSHHRRAYSLPQISQGYLLLPRRSPSPTPPPSITSSRHLPPPIPSRPKLTHSRTSSTSSCRTSTGEEGGLEMGGGGKQGHNQNQGVMWVTPAMQAFLKDGGVAQVRGGDGRMYKVRVPSRR